MTHLEELTCGTECQQDRREVITGYLYWIVLLVLRTIGFPILPDLSVFKST